MADIYLVFCTDNYDHSHIAVFTTQAVAIAFATQIDPGYDPHERNVFMQSHVYVQPLPLDPSPDIARVLVTQAQRDKE